jgi:putative ABC transport system ATP-binding protein
MPPLVEAEALVKTYQGGRVRALDGLDFSAEEGDMVAITGPNGGGKSTLLPALSGLIGLDAGQVRIGGRRPATPAERVALRARAIGMVFQEDWLPPGLTAAETVELPMLGVEGSAAARRARVAALLEEVGAAALAARHPAGLSGGERQRVAAACRRRFLVADGRGRYADG